LPRVLPFLVKFVLLLPHTESTNAFIIADRIRQEVEKEEFTAHDLTDRLIVSDGLVLKEGT